MIEKLPRDLNRGNLVATIEDYLRMLEEIPASVTSGSPLGLLTRLKRQNVQVGPYPNVTLFEAANRIMTDLVILFGVQILLEENPWAFPFTEYRVEFGNENRREHDILARNGGEVLKGEAFNVAPSFFGGKKRTSLKKLRGNRCDTDVLLLMYNHDAVGDAGRPQRIGHEYFLPVRIAI